MTRNTRIEIRRIKNCGIYVYWMYLMKVHEHIYNFIIKQPKVIKSSMINHDKHNWGNGEFPRYMHNHKKFERYHKNL